MNRVQLSPNSLHRQEAQAGDVVAPRAMAELFTVGTWR
jgi:hypothetical protein